MFHLAGSHIFGVCIDTRVDLLFFTRGGPVFDIMSTDLGKPEPRIVLQDKAQIFDKYSSMDVDTDNKRLYAAQFSLGTILSCDYDGGNSHVHVIGLPASTLTYWPKVQKVMLQIGKVLWTYGPDTFKKTVYYRLPSFISNFLITEKGIILFGRKRCFVLSENKTRVKINVIFPPEAFIHKSIII
ncbi:uncharacterized protein [Haliotis cracherodii]|uniref:uncharacterized protein n=1 Tax=Haliotis cracherodii TaxID=6455 RepID=UPI0039EC2ACC